MTRMATNKRHYPSNATKTSLRDALSGLSHGTARSRPPRSPFLSSRSGFSSKLDNYDAKDWPGKSNKQTKTCFDVGDKPLSASVTVNNVTTNYASNALYESFGAPIQLDFGNGFRETRYYNAHLQLQQLHRFFDRFRARKVAWSGKVYGARNWSKNLCSHNPFY